MSETSITFLDESFDFNKAGKDFIFNTKTTGLFTSTQIRKFLSAVNAITNRLEAGDTKLKMSDVQYLRVKLAYQTGRAQVNRDTNKLKPLYDFLDPKMAMIKTPDHFKKFARLMESIVAYHKFYGGAD